jgi:predicted PurR-regulated permease PerM
LSSIESVCPEEDRKALELKIVGFSPSAARATWTAVVILVLLYAAYQVRGRLFIFVLAIFFSYMLYPIVEFVERHAHGRLSRTSAAAVVYLFVVVVLIAALMLVGKQIASQATDFGQAAAAAARDPQSIDRLPLPNALGPLRDRVHESVQQATATFSENAMKILKRVGGQILHYAGNLLFVILIPILSFLFVKYAPVIRQALFNSLASDADHAFWWSFLNDLNIFIAHYVRTILLLALAVFAAYSAFFSVMGVPYALLLAGVAALFELVPLIGPFTAAVLVVLLSAARGFPDLLGLVIFLAAYRLFQDYVLNPLVMSSGTKLNPLLVIFAVLAGERLGGVRGVLLAIPVLGAARSLAHRLVRAPDCSG